MSSIFTEITTFVQTKDSLSKVVRHLDKWGCCARCILRFVGVKDADVFRTNDAASLSAWVMATSAEEDSDDAGKKTVVDLSTVNGTVAESELAKSSRDVVTSSCETDAELPRSTVPETVKPSCVKPTVCTACLGILQEHFCCAAFTDSIGHAVGEQQFEYNTFLCSISLPVSLLLREYGIFLALHHVMSSIFADIQRDSITPVKDVWKWVNGPRLASALKTPFDQKSPFEIVISFTFAQNDDECRFLYGLQPHIFRKRKKNQKRSQSVDVFNRANVLRSINECSREAFRCAYKCPPNRPSTEVAVSPIVCQHAALYIAGRYTQLTFCNFCSISSNSSCQARIFVIQIRLYSRDLNTHGPTISNPQSVC